MNATMVLMFILLCIGLYFIVCELLKVPYAKKAKAVISTANKSHKVKHKDVIIHDITNAMAKLVKIDNYKRENMLEKFKVAGIVLTPEQFIAKALLKPVIFGVLTIILLKVFPLGSIATGALAICFYLRDFENIEVLIDKKRRKIENELTRFVSQISKYLEHNKDVLSILEMYMKYAGPEFASELQITIADMRSGNYETALSRLESRVNSTALSDVVRGLKSVIQGNDTKTYWETMNIKFSEMSRINLEKEAQKVPAKVNRCTTVIVFCFIAMVGVVLATTLVQNANIFRM